MYSIDLKTSGSVVLGGTVEFEATLLIDGKSVEDFYEVEWTDNMSPPHKRVVGFSCSPSIAAKLLSALK